MAKSSRLHLTDWLKREIVRLLINGREDVLVGYALGGEVASEHLREREAGGGGLGRGGVASALLDRLRLKRIPIRRVRRLLGLRVARLSLLGLVLLLLRQSVLASDELLRQRVLLAPGRSLPSGGRPEVAGRTSRRPVSTLAVR